MKKFLIVLIFFLALTIVSSIQADTVPKILEIKYSIEKMNPPNLVIEVTGMVPTGGWTNPKLLRYEYRAFPKDAIWEFKFSANKPAGMVTQAFTKIKATYKWKNYNQMIKGIRVHGVGNGSKEILFQGNKKKRSPRKEMWRAWTRKGKLVVEGIYKNGGPGLIANLEPASPQGINPNVLLMKLSFEKLPGAWPEVITPIPMHYTKKSYKEKYESIQIIYPNNEIVSFKVIQAK